MTAVQHYESPLGEMLLAADESGLTGVWFVGQENFPEEPLEEAVEQETPVLAETKRWLDIYFSGQKPGFLPTLHPVGTPFRQEVWKRLCQIPYGETRTYGEIAQQVAENRGLRTMSAQAVGGALAHNPISILIPCHRVMGTDGSLTGYAGGLERKTYLLHLERTGKSQQ